MSGTERAVLVTIVGPGGRCDVAADVTASVAELCEPLADRIGFGPGVTAVALLPAREPDRARAAGLDATLAGLGALDGDTVSVLPPHLRARHSLVGWHAGPDGAHTEPVED